MIDWTKAKTVTKQELAALDKELKGGASISKANENLALASLQASFNKDPKTEKLLSAVILRILTDKNEDEAGLIRRNSAILQLVNPLSYPGNYIKTKILPKAYQLILKDKRATEAWLDFMVKNKINLDEVLVHFFANPSLTYKQIDQVLNDKSLSQEVFDMCLLDYRNKMIERQHPTITYLQRAIESTSIKNYEREALILSHVGKKLGAAMRRSNLDLLDEKLVLTLAYHLKGTQSRKKLGTAKCCPPILSRYLTESVK